ncbi:hypothetical protein [Rhodanobacter sp. L36]|uniref:hypothetical protein n=1 Tax=Rhodanobacter sp. L36 TaxID=1747221 RepID=UPI00131D92EB|nr:hypothetical protein [Rhodanobacter sp. L36]
MNFVSSTLKWTIVIFLMISLLSGCGPTRTEQLEQKISSLQTQLENMQNKLDNAKEKADDAQTELEGLQAAVEEADTNVSRFNEDNWRSVVPDVEDAEDDVHQKTDASKEAVDEVVNALE